MKSAQAILLLCVGALCFVSAQYHGHSVVYVPKASESEIEAIQVAGLDIWATFLSESGAPNEFALDVMVSQETVDVLDQLGLDYSIKIADVQANIDREEREIMEARSKSKSVDIRAAPDDWYTAYHTYDEFVTHLQELAKAYPTLVEFVPSIGYSLQNRSLPALVINTKLPTVDKYFYLLSGQHAREWVAPATTLYVAEQLLVQYAAGNADAVALLRRAAIHVIPMSNPDGYVHSWPASSGGGGTRLWRKNRRLNSNGSYGVDLNRNWDDGHWGCCGGSSNTPSAEDYRGPSAFSEPEGKAVANYVLSQPFKFDGMIDYHSYSQLIMRPPGWTSAATVNETVLAALGTGVRTAILGVENKSYTSQRSYQLYATTGTSDDWGYYKGGIVFSYCIELRDTGTYGFQLPANQILPTGRENFAGLKYWLNFIISRN